MKTNKFKICGLIAINGKQKNFTQQVWATSGAMARAQVTTHWMRIVGCSTVQIWTTSVVDAE